MPKKGLKFALLLTVLAGLFYLGYYLYSNMELYTVASCSQMEGACKDRCSYFEEDVGVCEDKKCCKPLSLDRTLIFAAMETRNISKCRVGGGADDICQLAVLDTMEADSAKKSLDETMCANILDDGIRDTCYSDLALMKKDHAVCNYITYQSVHEKCHLAFVTGMEDWNICKDDIISEFSKNVCFKKIAFLSKRIEVCDQITFDFDKYDCYMGVELSNKLQYDVRCEEIGTALCNLTKGCTLVVIKEGDEMVYGGCKRDANFFCTQTGGRWLLLPSKQLMKDSIETCVCKDRKAYFEGYGCFDCIAFENSYVKGECNKLLSAQASA